MISNILEKIPLKIRGAFYSLPLFIQWIIALSWEQDPKIKKVAGRSMMLSFLFLGQTVVLYFLTSLIIILAPGAAYSVQMFLFAWGALMAILYVITSLYLALMELVGKSPESFFLDGIVMGFFRRAGEN